MNVQSSDILNLVYTDLRITAKILIIVVVFMSIIEFIEQKYSYKIKSAVTNRPTLQIVLASFLGAIPGCIDAFLIVSLYIHGKVGFGALTAVMLSTAGDEAFIMLTLIPDATLKILIATIFFGIIGGLIAEKIGHQFNLKLDQSCEFEISRTNLDNGFFKEHIINHIILGHAPRLFLWIFIPLTLIDILLLNVDFSSMISNLPIMLLIFFASILGIIPESGPHLVFVILYSRGLIPFSVLLVSTLSQDGHGLLPLLSHSFKDTMYVQLFTTIFSLTIGILLINFGI